MSKVGAATLDWRQIRCHYDVIKDVEVTGDAVMETQALYSELASARRADLVRQACRHRTIPGPATASPGGVRRRVSRLLIDVGRRLADDG